MSKDKAVGKQKQGNHLGWLECIGMYWRVAEDKVAQTGCDYILKALNVKLRSLRIYKYWEKYL